MIAIDTSSWIAFLSSEMGASAPGRDVALVDKALADRQACVPPVVLTELFSDPKLAKAVAASFLRLPVLAVTEGYWERAGALRAKLLLSKRRARLADTLIAQSCIDHGVALVTRDSDFRYFAKYGRLKLAVN